MSLLIGQLEAHASDLPSSVRDSKQQLVVVLGMHRSGTSLCMNVLNALGIRVDNDLAADVNNPRGYFEPEQILRLNDKILEAAGLNWNTVFSPALHGRWRDNPALRGWKQQVSDYITEKVHGGQGLWAIKEPRISLLLPIYEQIFAEHNLSPIYVLCVRDPRSVALSLKQRDEFPAILSELLWLDHTMGAMAIAGDRIKAVVHYEKWFEDGKQQILSLADAIGLSEASRSQLAKAGLDEIIDPALNHGNTTGPFALRDVQEIYRLLLVQDYAGAMEHFLEVQRGLSWGTHPNSRCQIFWRTNEQDRFTEACSRSVRTVVSSERRIIRVPIPAQDEPVVQVRLDIADVPGNLHLFAIRVLDSNGEKLWEWDGGLSTLLSLEHCDMTPLANADGGVLVSMDTDDPRVILPVSEKLASLAESGAVEIELAWLESQSELAVGDLSQALKAAETELSKLRENAAQLDKLREDVAEQSRQVDSLRKQMERMGKYVASERKAQERMLRSWSWRLTAPVRFIGSIFMNRENEPAD